MGVTKDFDSGMWECDDVKPCPRCAAGERADAIPAKGYDAAVHEAFVMGVNLEPWRIKRIVDAALRVAQPEAGNEEGERPAYGPQGRWTQLRQERDEARAEAEHLRERVALLMLDEPSKTAGLYAAIDELQRENERLRAAHPEADRAPEKGTHGDHD